MPMYDQAKWYELYFPGDADKRTQFKLIVFSQQCIYNIGIKRPWFMGQKKLKQLIIEANLLGLEDSLIIFERRKRNG